MDYQRIIRFIGVYAAWMIVSVVGIWLIIISQSALLALAEKYYIDDIFMRQTLIRFLDKSYMFVIGLIWFVMVIVTEESFRRGVEKGRVFQRFAIVCAVELLLIFGFDVIILFIQNWRLVPIRVIILIAELSLGVGLLLAKRRSETRQTGA